MSDIGKTEIGLDREGSSKHWTLSSIFTLTDKDGREIYRDRTAIVLDRDGLQAAYDLIGAQLKESG